ncbi:MAG TPA: NYN domain-containing protein, partial [Alphaproteobacteria bacterium]|nr:NYN domain-containing protein [Alphaproteobacteria bacterium]
IPHVRVSGKNSADIRLVVDALDLCYTKPHIDTFVIISGDSDFSPLVSKLRENARTVIGVGVKNSTSDLLINNCDEFIYYDDLVRPQESRGKSPRRRGRGKAKEPEKEAGKAAPAKAKDKADEAAPEDRTQEGIDLVLQTAEALQAERGDRAKLWGSMIKQTLKRRRPGFNESYYGFRSFSDLLEEAESRGQLALELDTRSGGYVVSLADGAG